MISKWFPWAFSKHGDGRYVIRRYRKVNGKTVWETYRSNKYKNFTETEIEALLKRLNASWLIEEAQAKARFDFDHSYINKIVLDGFSVFLSTQASSAEHIDTLMSVIHSFTLDFFINKLKLPDPNHWKKQEAAFGQYLLKKKLSAGYIKRVVQTSNRLLLTL